MDIFNGIFLRLSQTRGVSGFRLGFWVPISTKNKKQFGRGLGLTWCRHATFWNLLRPVCYLSQWNTMCHFLFLFPIGKFLGNTTPFLTFIMFNSLELCICVADKDFHATKRPKCAFNKAVSISASSCARFNPSLAVAGPFGTSCQTWDSMKIHGCFRK